MHFCSLPILLLAFLTLLPLASSCLIFYGGYTQEDNTPFGTIYGSLIDNGKLVCSINAPVTPIRPMWLDCIEGYYANIDQPFQPKMAYAHDNKNFLVDIQATPIEKRYFWRYWAAVYGCPVV